MSPRGPRGTSAGGYTIEQLLAVPLHTRERLAEMLVQQADRHRDHAELHGARLAAYIHSHRFGLGVTFAVMNARRAKRKTLRIDDLLAKAGWDEDVPETDPHVELAWALEAAGITPVSIVNAVHGDHDERTREPDDAVEAMCALLWPDDGSES